jgi:hypothetical protein
VIAVKAFDLAVRLVESQPGGSERALSRHRSGPDGCCAGCGYGQVRWPCFLAAVALRAGGAGGSGSGP